MVGHILCEIFIIYVSVCRDNAQENRNWSDYNYMHIILFGIPVVIYKKKMCLWQSMMV